MLGTFFRSPGTRYSSRRGLEGVKQEGAPGGIVGSPGNLPTIGRYTSVVMPYIYIPGVPEIIVVYYFCF